MKRWTFFILFAAIFLILSYAPISKSLEENLYIKNERVISGNCPAWFELDFAFNDSNGNALSHCVEKSAYNESTVFVVDSYIQIGLIPCKSSYTEFDEFSTNSGRVTLCKMKQIANESFLMKSSSFSFTNCSKSSFTDGNNQTIFHCKTEPIDKSSRLQAGMGDPQSDLFPCGYSCSDNLQCAAWFDGNGECDIGPNECVCFEEYTCGSHGTCVPKN